MQRGVKRLRRVRIPPTLGLGIALGLLQLLLLWVADSLNWLFLPWWLYMGTGALFYLVIPGVAALLASLRTVDDVSGPDVGCGVWGISILVIIIATLFILSSAAPCPPSCSGLPSMGGFLGYIDFFLEGICGAFIALLGGAIGGSIGRNRAVVLSQQGRTAAPRTN
jgi:hypothetical protein